MTEGETRDTQDADTRCVCWERGFDNTNCELRKDDSSRHPKGLEELSLRVATLILGSDVGTTPGHWATYIPVRSRPHPVNHGVALERT